MATPPERPPSTVAGIAVRRIVLGLGVRELGIAGVAAVVLLAAGIGIRGGRGNHGAEQTAIRAELAEGARAAGRYRKQVEAVRTQTEQIRSWAEAQTGEPLHTWARERLRLAERLRSALSREAEAGAFSELRKGIEERCERGDLAADRTRLAHLAPPVFPTAGALARLRRELYEQPLAEFSRQNPAYYRAFRQFEAEAARKDEVGLRAEIAAAGEDEVNPQTMLKVELLAAVAAADDPLVAKWSALTSAMDYFENPDEPTLAHWRRAQRAGRTGNWDLARSEMQAILMSKVRTRQPFRAAFARAWLKSRPDDPSAAYPYLAEAATAGDKQARAWVAGEDIRAHRYAQAQRWLEAAVVDGDVDAVTPLVELYEKHPEPTADPLHQAGVLVRATDRSDAAPSALLFLGRLYERIDPPGAHRRAFDCYSRAAAKGCAAAAAEVARCAWRGIGTPRNPDEARDAACRAFASGERTVSVPVLSELLVRMPDRVADAIDALLDEEQVNGGGGYLESHVTEGPGVSQLKSQLARYFDQIGRLGRAAHWYAGAPDPAAQRRYGELTASHPCERCGGLGQVEVSAVCPACGGQGRQTCSFCGGTGTLLVPGPPPCPACGGSGITIAERRMVACSTCNGSGKAKGSVTREDCTHCDRGYVRCLQCTHGVVKVMKECPECHGRGAWAWVDRMRE